MATASAQYPRPDFQRQELNWTSLNGAWDFAFDDDDTGLDEKAKRTIEVPFVFQAPASGIGERSAHEVLWYERSFTDIRTPHEIAKGHRLLSRFGAVDYEATVWVNHQFIGRHRGGHVPFDFDITDAMDPHLIGPHHITVRVRDSPYDLSQPRGKQYWGPEPENIFYTPSSGIWQSVWLESVPRMRIGDSSRGTVLRSDDIENGVLHAKIAVLGRRAGSKCAVKLSASFRGLQLESVEQELPRDKESAVLDLSLRLQPSQRETVLEHDGASDNEACWREGVALWSPEHPLLYDVRLLLLDSKGQEADAVNTIVGMRSLSWANGDGTFRLNGKPLFQALVLDQGYWPQTLMTPPSADSLKADIELSKRMGFNGCRKHQKVEDPIFLYWADRLGYLVWGETANAYEFSSEYVERFDEEWMAAVKRDINHPCIVAWTPVNESWGYTSLKDSIEQRNHIRSLYYMTKTLDPSRPINDNCGWEHVLTDLTTFHDYADGPELEKTCLAMTGILGPKADHDLFVPPIYGSAAAILDSRAEHKSGAPILCTEFGGVNIASAKDAPSAGEKDWGYTTARDPEDLLRRIEKLVVGVVKGRHCCGLVYTQLTDIEQEVNGLYSYDRKAKIDPGRVKEIMEKAAKIYFGET